MSDISQNHQQSSLSSINDLKSLSNDSLAELVKPFTVDATSPRSSFRNWGQTFSCKPLAIFEPRNEDDCQLLLELARREGKSLRPVGVGHSPSDLACTSEYMARMEGLNRVMEVDKEKCTVTVQGGITLHALHDVLAQHGLAMSVLGSISDQTLAGVVTTATHGTGIDYACISAYVLALTILLADGSIVDCSRTRRKELFMASLCGLGATGIVLRVKLQVEPAFRLREEMVTLPFDNAVAVMDEFNHKAEHVRFWWFPAAGVMRIGSASRTDEPRKPSGSWLWNSLLGFHFVQFFLFLGRFIRPIIPLIGRFAAWLERDPAVHVDDGHRIFNVDCRYPQHTTEWAIPYENTEACLNELRNWVDEELADPRGLRPHFPIEIRFSAADDIWLSPSYGQKTCWIGIVQYKPYGLNVPYRALFSRFEQILARHSGRPHWAKAHGFRPAELRSHYEHFDDFVQVLEQVDPEGRWRNEYVRRHVFGETGDVVGQRIFKERKM